MIAPAAEKAGIMAEILLISDGFFHPPFLARRALRAALESLPGLRFTPAGHLNALLELHSERYQALVLYFHHKQADPAAFAALERFVQRGGGILAIHSATASFKDQAPEERGRYFEILGGRFTGHGPVAPFAVQPAGGIDPAFAGIQPFTVQDELYLHDVQPDIRIQFEALHEGEMQPVGWIRQEGDGRVCYIGPGHRAQTMQQPQMQAILQRGLLWVMQQ
jgi:type 1 glutamine amidotransferase